MKIGFIGLGLMGEPMATNIIKKSSYEVFVYDVSSENIEKLVAQGAIASNSTKEIGENCDVIITMVPKNEHVKAVYKELTEVSKNGQIYIDMSTISPDVSIEIAKEISKTGAVMLDAPVVKSRPAAIDGVLGIYVGGDEKAFETVKHILGYMGNNIIHLGENGNGLVMKLCHNMLVSQIQNGVNEMLCLANKTAGIDPITFAKAISYGGGQNFYLDTKVNSIAKEDYTTMFSVENMHKDVCLAKELCIKNGLELLGVELANKRYEDAITKGFGKEDFCATYKLMD